MIRFLREWEEKCLLFADDNIPWCAPLIRRYRRMMRYIISGGTAAIADLATLYFLTDKIGIHYLISSVLAFFVAFCISFFLQKFWTFEENNREQIHSQAALYFVITGSNVLVNVGLMYFLVEIIGVWYFASQIIAGAIIACYSFLLYKSFVFSQKNEIAGDNSESRS